jgi:hypothetical protein
MNCAKLMFMKLSKKALTDLATYRRGQQQQAVSKISVYLGF